MDGIQRSSNAIFYKMEVIMCDFIDDDFGWEDLAIALGMGEEIAREERERFKLLQDEAEDYVKNDDIDYWTDIV